MSLSLQPPRVALVDPQTGMITREWYRFLGDMFVRVGSANGMSSDDFAILSAFSPVPDLTALNAVSDLHASIPSDRSALIAEMQKRIDDIQQQMEGLIGQAANLAELLKFAQGIELDQAFPPPATDWEHPGRIGDKKASSGKFTTLDASGAVTLNPANALVDLSPTGTGTVRVNPATIVGTMDNVVIGLNVPASGRFTTVNKLTFTQPATGATFTLADGKTFTVSSTLTLSATDGATLAIGGGGTLGTAAYTAASTYALVAGSSTQNFAANALTAAGAFGCNGKAAQASLALGAAATDLATVITLANNLRTMAINNGTGS